MPFLFKIQIKDITNPSVWRRVVVPKTFSFYQFHEVIQAAFGWGNCHLFLFGDKGYRSEVKIGVPDPDYDDFKTQDSKSILLNQIFNSVGQTFTYIYDFGDDWTHKIILEKITDIGLSTADCIEGEGACPPENCRGAFGYEMLKATMLKPRSRDYKSTREWLGLTKDEPWDVTAFDLQDARESVKTI